VDLAPSDADLVRRACAGDRWAEEAIYRRYVQYVASVVSRMLRSNHETLDVVHDTFITAYESLDSLRDGRALRVWLAAIAVNHVRRRLRWRRLIDRLGFTDQGIHQEPIACGPDASPELRAELTLLEQALGRISLEERAAWVLHRVHDETLDDVAVALGCSLATAKRRIAAAQASLNQILSTGAVS
jgi:RNA polymerase sigma-70 factor (ECF subfamily)